MTVRIHGTIASRFSSSYDRAYSALFKSFSNIYRKLQDRKATSVSLCLHNKAHVTTFKRDYLAETRSKIVKSAGFASTCTPYIAHSNRVESVFDIFDRPIYKPRKSYKFQCAISGLPKKPTISLVNDGRLLAGQCGDDSFFLRVDSMGVADGVGGWYGVPRANPALYSRKLMHYCSLELSKYDDLDNDTYSAQDYYNLNAQAILEKGFFHVESDCVRESFLGSTTALVSVLRDDQLRIAHLGDCALMVIRDDDIIFRTEEQQHSFNFPFQLGTQSRDRPSDAQSFAVPVKEGDLVIMGTDGIFDNLFDDQVLQSVKLVLANRKSVQVDPQHITDTILRHARDVAEDTRTSVSPFQSRAIQEGMYYRGGKMDDMTVTAGIVRLIEDSSDRR